MQNDNNKKNIGGGLLALIIVISIFSGCVAGAGFMHMFTNDSFLMVPDLSPVGTETTVAPTTSGMQTSFIDPSVTALPEITPPVIDSNEPIADLYEKLRDTVVMVQNFQNGQLKGTGSGVIFTTDGYILTNYHVIENASAVTVLLSDETELETVIVGGDKRSDLAVLKITRNGTYSAAALGNSSSLRIGQKVVAIGAPLGYSGTVTQGIVSYLNRAVDTEGVRKRMIQTDCAINPGNSGGPLFNLSGEVIGITSMKEVFTATEEGEIPVEGVGYAIPIDTAKTIALTLISEGKVTRGAIGIMAQSNIVNNKYSGVKVIEVTSGGPAHKAGIKENDIIIKLDGVEVEMMEDLSEQLSFKKVGQTVKVTVMRGNSQIDFDVTLTVLTE